MRILFALIYTVAAIIVTIFAFAAIATSSGSFAIQSIFFLIPAAILASAGYVWWNALSAKNVAVGTGAIFGQNRFFVIVMIIVVFLFGTGYLLPWTGVLFEESGLISWVHFVVPQERADPLLYTNAFKKNDRKICDLIKNKVLKARCYMNVIASDMNALDCLEEGRFLKTHEPSHEEGLCLGTFVYQRALTDMPLDCSDPVLVHHNQTITCLEMKAFQALRMRNSSNIACNSVLDSGHLDRSLMQQYTQCVEQ